MLDLDTMEYSLLACGLATDPVGALRDLRGLQRFTARLQVETVQRARAEGVSWQRIGEALGLPEQEARDRFGRFTAPAAS